MTDPSKEELLAAVARQDRAAFAALFRQLAPPVQRYFARSGVPASQVDDLVQDVMVQVWRKAGSFDASRASAATWVFAIARNRRIDAIRRERHPEVDPADPALVPAPERAADALAGLARERERLAAAFKSLPPDQRRVIESAYFRDDALPAIAAEEGVALGTVKSRVRLALDRLRIALSEGR